MAKPRATTIQQRFGFMDPDLTTPQHDKIMLWLEDYIRERIQQDYQSLVWKPGHVAELRKRADGVIAGEIVALREKHQSALASVERGTRGTAWYGGENRDVAELSRITNALEGWPGLGDCPPVPLPDVEVTWEYPVKSDKYIVGFVDMAVWFMDSSLDIANIEKKPYEKAWRLVTWDKLPEWNVGSGREVLWLFEVKSAIPSLGEAIRQIRMYKAYQTGRYHIVSPDDCYRDALEGQGIRFIKYEPASPASARLPGMEV